MDTIKLIYRYFCKSYLITTDSRNVQPESIFFALKGGKFDGNNFALEVAKKGVVGYVITDKASLPAHRKIIHVNDTLETLQQLASYHRNNTKATVIGITGTNGKTTTKELVAAVLSKKYKTISTQGNLNNHIGVPLSLLQIKPDTEMAVIEMGANHPHEIETLCNIAQPDFGIITNIGKAHLEGFGSLNGIINTKRELYNYIGTCSEKKTIFINRNNETLMGISNLLMRYTYGTTSDCNVCAKIESCDPCLSIRWGNHIIKTHLIGDYNLENVMAALAVGKYFNVEESDIINAIESYEPVNNRSQILETGKNKIIMDAYNANPTSMRHAISNFNAIFPDNNTLIVGDMLELGSESRAEHQTIIDLIKEYQFEQVILVGEQFWKLNHEASFKYFLNTNQLCQYLNDHQIVNHNILIKGSRGIQLEKVYPYL